MPSEIEPPSEWFEDSSFWEELYPYMFSPERLDAASEEVQKIVLLTHFQGGSVLDLCCGPGRHAIAFAKAGCHVTGVDKTLFLLEKARETAAQEDVDVEWIEEDMKEFTRENSYDVVVNLFTAFGYFDNKKDDIQVLRNVVLSLRPGGRFVLDVKGKESVAAGFRTTDCDFHADGSFMTIRREIFDSWSRIRNEWTLVRDGKMKTFKFHHTLYSAQELRDRFEQVGFRKVEIFGDWDGSDYGPGSRRLIVIGTK